MRVTAAERRHWPLPCQTSQRPPRNHARPHLPQTRCSVAVILQQQEEQHRSERHCGVAISLAHSSSRALCISTIHNIMIVSQGVWHTRLSHDRAESAQPKICPDSCGSVRQFGDENIQHLIALVQLLFESDL